MSDLLVVTAGVAALGVSSAALLRIPKAEEVRRLELRFGPDLTEGVVCAVLGGISGLPARARVRFEVVGDSAGLRHYLAADSATLELLRAQLRGMLPGLRLESTEVEPSPWRAAARLTWTGGEPVLRTDQSEAVAGALLGAMSGLTRGETVLLRWTLAASAHPRLPERPAGRRASNGLRWLWPERHMRLEDVRALRQKYSGPLVMGKAVVAVAAPSTGRAVHLLNGVASVFRGRSTSRGRLVVRRRTSGGLESFMERDALGRGCRLSAAELAGLLAWPIDAPRVPGLVLGVAPQLMPAARIPTSGGRTWARSTWPGMERRRLVQPVVGGLSHALIAGPSGVGKSSLVASLVAQDLAAGRGCLVIDGKGDLAGDVLALVPERRRDDVIVLDPGAGGPVPGLRVFGNGDPELIGDLVLGVFRSIFSQSWGVRSDQWLRAGLVTLAHDRASTLADLPFLFADEGFRRRLVGRLKDPLMAASWAAFEAMSPQARAQQLGAPLNKVNEVIGRRVVRTVLAQPQPKWDMGEVLRRGQVVIVALAPGVIGAPAARLLGALVLHELFQSVQARASVPVSRRRPFYVYVDEPKVLADIPVPLDSLYELARGFGVGLTVAVQSLSQLPHELQRAAMTNASTLVAFRQNADDARLLASELPGVTPEELQHLGRFEIAARLGLGPGDVTPPVTGRTIAPPAPLSDARQVQRYSAERFGADAEAVDAMLRQRHGIGGDERPSGSAAAPVRRRRRQQ